MLKKSKLLIRKKNKNEIIEKEIEILIKPEEKLFAKKNITRNSACDPYWHRNRLSREFIKRRGKSKRKKSIQLKVEFNKINVKISN